jgi:hypothetical protein
LRTSLVSLSKHEIITASYLGWGELTNGEMLRRAEQDGFEVFVTGDQRLIDEQKPHQPKDRGYSSLSQQLAPD